MNKKKVLGIHKKNKGKLEVSSKFNIDKKNLSLIYTPGVSEVSKKIYANKRSAYDYTIKGNTVAVVSDGSSVLGLGNIGAEAALPVMEGKCVLFKEFADVDAFPICLQTQDKGEIIKIVKNISPVFGGINLEDIEAPKCFEIEDKLQSIGIPVMHDDQHATAIVVLAGLINACEVVGKSLKDLKVVLNGAGAAGSAIAKLLVCEGASGKKCDSVKDLIVFDSKGPIYAGRKRLGGYKKSLAKVTNKKNFRGSLREALLGADVFIGVSKGNIITEEMVEGMKRNAIVFALANPVPEIMPDKAKNAGASVVATGRSDFPNQVNNALVFPGIFRGLLDSGSKRLTLDMKLNAAYALASVIRKPTKNKITPSIFDKRVVKSISKAICKSSGKKC